MFDIIKTEVEKEAEEGKLCILNKMTKHTNFGSTPILNYQKGERIMSVYQAGKKFILVISIISILCMCIRVSNIYAINLTEDVTLINEPHIFSTTPDDPEWDTFTTVAERRNACHVPLEELQAMTTEALVDTILNYPLLIDIYAYDDLETGIAAVSKYFGGIEELMRRNDAVEILSTNLENRTTNRSARNMIDIYLESLLQAVNGYIEPYVYPYGEPGTVTTPNGSTVNVTVGKAWTNESNDSYYDALIQQEEYLDTYSTAVAVSYPNPAFNCHSYAWYEMSEENNVWMPDPRLYMTDGSYSACSVSIGAKVYYSSSNNFPVHSGVIVNLPVGGNSAKVQSKWGKCGIFIHSQIASASWTPAR